MKPVEKSRILVKQKTTASPHPLVSMRTSQLQPDTPSMKVVSSIHLPMQMRGRGYAAGTADCQRAGFNMSLAYFREILPLPVWQSR